MRETDGQIAALLNAPYFRGGGA